MNVVEKIKNHFGRIYLHAEIKKQKKQNKLISFDSINEIGIVYNADNTSEEIIAHNFASHLRNEGKKVLLLGFVNQNKLPHNKKIHISSEFFCREKLNWFNLPEKNKIGRFLEIRFDLLLNLYHDNLLPLQAISVYSKAQYKMGGNIKDALKYFDFIIDTGNTKDINNLANQMEHYLKSASCINS